MKKTVSLLVSSAVLLAALSGCTGSGMTADTDDIIDAAEKISDLIISRDDVRLQNLIDGRYQLISSSLVFDDDGPDEGTLQLRNAIADTMEYQVIEDSCEAVSSTEGNVDVTFSFADYEKVLEDGAFSDASEASEAISSCEDRMEITVNMDLVFKDDDWKLYNFDVIPDCFPFEDEVFTFSPDLQDMIISSSWDEASDGVYTNSPRLRYVITLDPERTGDTLSYSYQIAFEGDIIEESDLITDNTPEEIVILYTCGQDGQDFLPVGSYSITVFDENGNEMLTDECSAVYESSWAEKESYDLEDIGLRFNLPADFSFLPPGDYYYNYLFSDFDNVIFVASDYDNDIFISVILFDNMRNPVTYDNLDSYIETLCNVYNADPLGADDPDITDSYSVSRVDLAGNDLPALDQTYTSSDYVSNFRYVYIPSDEGLYEISVFSEDAGDLAYYTENFWEVIDQ